jgi:hypothetical protein
MTIPYGYFAPVFQSPGSRALLRRYLDEQQAT